MDPSEPNPAISGWAFQTVLRFTNAYTGPQELATLEFAIQVPSFHYAVVDDDVYSNGDTVSIELGTYTRDATSTKGWLCRPGRGIERLVLLPDFSNVDSRFALGNSVGTGTGLPLGPVPNSLTGRYDLTRWG